MEPSIRDVVREYSYGVFYPFVALLSLFYRPKVTHNPHAKKGIIVLVFCWFTPNTSHYKWVSYLEKREFRTYLINLPLLHEDYQKTAKRLEKIINQHHLKNYTLVGISSGALVCLYFLHQFHKWKEIHRFISIGGPLQGTPKAYAIAFCKKGRDMLPGSIFIKKLIKKRIPSKKMVTVSATYDELVPAKYSHLEGIPSYEISVWGHNRFHLGCKKTYDLISQLAA